MANRSLAGRGSNHVADYARFLDRVPVVKVEGKTDPDALRRFIGSRPF